MTPSKPYPLIREMHAYDPNLRLRWGRHQGTWIVECKLPPRLQQYVSERPSPFKSPRGLDLYEGWRAGYVHVLNVPPEAAENVPYVMQAIRDADTWRQGGMDQLARRLDEQDAQVEAQADRTIANWVEGATSDAYDRLQWLQGNRVAITPPAAPVLEDRDGFKIRDRRRLTCPV